MEKKYYFISCWFSNSHQHSYLPHNTVIFMHPFTWIKNENKKAGKHEHFVLASWQPINEHERTLFVEQE